MGMEKLSEYMIKRLPDVDRHIIKSVLQHYNQWNIDNHGKFCEICDVVLILDNTKIPCPYDFLSVCKTHEKYANRFRVDIIRKELGIKPKEHLNDL